MLNKANLRDDIFTSLIQFAEMISVYSDWSYSNAYCNTAVKDCCISTRSVTWDKAIRTDCLNMDLHLLHMVILIKITKWF